MDALARFVVRRRRWVLVGWLLLALAGGFAAPRAVDALSYDFGLPGRDGSEANQQIVERTGGGGDNPPLLVVVGDGAKELPAGAAEAVGTAVAKVAPGGRYATWADAPDLLSADGRVGVVLAYPRITPGPEPYAQALPTLDGVAEQLTKQLGVPVAVTGQPALEAEGGGGGADVLAETVFGGLGALVVLLLVFGSALAVMPLLIAAASILTTFLIVWGLASATEVSFIVQFLLALIGLGVAIDYALLVVTRWREEKAHDEDGAIERTMATAGRSVLFSGVTVAVSLAALIALPVPFLRSVGFTGLLIPLVSTAAALTLLPALLATPAGRRLEWPRRRSPDPVSRLWHAVGSLVVRHRVVAAVLSVLVLGALTAPVFGLRLGQPTLVSQAAGDLPADQAAHRLEQSGIGLGLAHPVEVLGGGSATYRDVPGVAGTADLDGVVAVWTAADTSAPDGSAAAARVRDAVTDHPVGGTPAQDADFLDAVYGNAPWVLLVIVLVTFALLARALHSIWLPVKALALNVLSVGAAYGITVLIWQHGIGTHLLFGRDPTGAITVWVPIAVFAFLFGLSMDYEVFLLSRIRESYDAGEDTDHATVDGLARTGRLVSSAALILFLAFISLSRVPTVDVKILATALALGILLDATVVRGVLAPALVALLGRANWWWPFSRRTRD